MPRLSMAITRVRLRSFAVLLSHGGSTQMCALRGLKSLVGP